MFFYWFLFAIPAVMALTYPMEGYRTRHPTAQGLAFITFLLFYVLLGALRYETGGDWLTYDEMFEDIRTDTFFYALRRTDILYGILNWVSAQLDTYVYLVNGVCCFILGYGVLKASMRMREPWLAILISVPYLLIVVGMGYVRQGAAIGLILMAIASIDQSRPGRTIAYLLAAVAFHASSAVMIPLFAFMIARRRKMLAIVVSGLFVFVFLYFVSPRLDVLEQGYIANEYDSDGAFVRLLMNFMPAFIILAFRKRFMPDQMARPIWIGIALASVVMMAVFAVSSSTTAIDRVALYFSIIQLAAFGEISGLLNLSPRMIVFVRLIMVGVAGAVQAVWLVFATHSQYWVPYKSVLQFF